MSPRLLLGAALLLGCPVPGPDDPAIESPCDAIHPDATVGLRRYAPSSSSEATLFAPNGSRTTWLIDPLGRVLLRDDYPDLGAIGHIDCD